MKKTSRHINGTFTQRILDKADFKCGSGDAEYIRSKEVQYSSDLQFISNVMYYEVTPKEQQAFLILHHLESTEIFTKG